MYCLVAAIGASDQQGFDQADFADAVSPEPTFEMCSFQGICWGCRRKYLPLATGITSYRLPRAQGTFPVRSADIQLPRPC